MGQLAYFSLFLSTFSLPLKDGQNMKMKPQLGGKKKPPVIVLLDTFS